MAGNVLAGVFSMKFGKTDHPERIDFALPEDHDDARVQLEQNKGKGQLKIYVGCAKWNRQDLKNFYPSGIKDELSYYSTQFNTIELNATFYRIFPSSVFIGWKNKTPDDFVFFPKLPQVISHRKRLQGVRQHVDEFLNNANHLQQKLGTTFLQMMENFGPKTSNNMENLIKFIRNWPGEFPLAVELRHTDWFNDPDISGELYALFEEYGITNIITDTAARRDLLHMRLTTPSTFIRYVGSNHESDYMRLDDWIDRLERWSRQGMRHIAFFIHQNHELESPLLARYFIEQLNDRMHCNLKVPVTLQAQQESLF